MPEAAPSARFAINKTIQKAGTTGGKERVHPRKAPCKPEQIRAQLLNPEKRAHLGPCCKTLDGTKWIYGTKKWGDGKGFPYTDGSTGYECHGCRKLLKETPTTAATADFKFDAADWAAVDELVAGHKTAP